MNTDYLMNHKNRNTAYLMLCGIILLSLAFIFRSYTLFAASIAVQVPISVIFLKRYGEITGQKVKHFFNVIGACVIIYLIEAIFAGLVFVIVYLIRLV